VSKVSEARSNRWAAAIAIALLSTVILVSPTLANPAGEDAGGNSEASAACENGGYANWTDAAGNAFRNAGACVSHAAHGGALMPVVVNPFAVSYRASGANGFVATLTGTGLQPSTGVDLILTWGGEPLFVGDVADPSGAITFEVSSVCASLGSPLTAVAAAGTVVGGVHTEYSLPLPGAAICPSPA
jgi:hypothetical protein